MTRSILWAILGGVMALLPEFIPVLAPLRLIAFVPLLWAERRMTRPAERLTALLLFVLLARLNYWLDPVRLPHFLILSLALGLFSFVKLQHGGQRGYISLIFLWVGAMSLPYYLSWNLATAAPLSKTFMSLEHWRNIPSTFGFFGAEIWIMAFNVLALRWLEGLKGGRSLARSIGLAAALILGGTLGAILVTFPIEPRPVLSKAAQGWTGLLPGDRFAARISFFIAGFLLLFSLVTGYLRRQKAL